MIHQVEIKLPAFSRGCHLITSHIRKALPNLPSNGILHVFIQHTSAGLTINENADPTVRSDLSFGLDRLAPENLVEYKHTAEGSDDMPAHIKSSLVGCSVSVPISQHELNLGTWQGIYLCEFRNYGGRRRLVLTIYS